MNESHPLTPRYGILTSNSSESVNSMLAEARKLGWIEAEEKFLDVMSTKISQRRQKYKQQSFFSPLVVETWVGFAAQVLQRLEGQQKFFPERKRRLF